MSLLHELIERSAARRPDSPALIKDAETLDYASLARSVALAAGGLRRAGLARRDRVAVYLPKQFEAVIAMFAASAADGIFVPVNPILKAAQVGHILRDSDARVLVTGSARMEMLLEELGSCPALETIVLAEEPRAAARVAGRRVMAWPELLSAGEARSNGSIDADPAAILYTSGSTGKPKGVVLSHRNIVAGAESVSRYLLNSEDDRLLAVLPLSFDYGFSQLSTAFKVGAASVLLDYLLPRDIVKAADRHEVTGIGAVPPLWIPLAELDWPDSVGARLRYLTNSGGAMPTPTLEKLRSRLPGTSIFLMYGLTEAFRSTYLPPEQADRRPTSMGKAIPNAEVLVLRPDGTECGPGEPGELVHRGALVSLGYWKDPERTAERFKPVPVLNGRLPFAETAVWSGDTVVKDDEGYLYFVGREDEMIKTSGYRVSPTEIEEVVYGSGLVAEAVAVGVPHAVLGQAVVLLAVAAGGADPDPTARLLDALKPKLPGYMLPCRVHWRRALPRNANGKIDRAGLAAECRQGRGDCADE
jgi:acyl-CoA ligase (AMP-forming) (exosortase A-associated)